MNFDFILPERPDTFLGGMDSLNNDRMLAPNTKSLLQNMSPGLTGIPRNGHNEKYRSIDGPGYGGGYVLFSAHNTYYEADGIGFILTWCQHIGAPTEYSLVAWSLADGSSEVVFSGNFTQSPVYASMMLLYDSVYVNFDYEFDTPNESTYRTRNKIIKYENGAWVVVENGISVAPRVTAVGVDDIAVGGFVARAYHRAISFGSRAYVIGGQTSVGSVMDILSTQNMQEFTPVNITEYELLVDNDLDPLFTVAGEQLYNDATGELTARIGHAVVEYDSKLWVIGGEDSTGRLNDVWYSEDGQVWVRSTESADWTARKFHTCLSYDGKLWVIGGDDGATGGDEVWYTTNGYEWAQATAAAAFGQLSTHASVVFGGKMWALLGDSLTCYSSTDGVTWTDEYVSGLVDLRYHTTLVYKGKMWIIAGDDDGVTQDTVYSSPDGATWTTETAAPDFGDRYAHASVVFNSQMWVLGGYETSAGYYDDAYFSTDGITWAVTGRGINDGLYVNYAFAFVRREDEASILSSFDDYIFEVWSTYEGVTRPGPDERLLAGTVSLSGTALTGSGTDFTQLTANTDYIRIAGSGKAYLVTGVTNATTATLANAEGDSYSAEEYAQLPRIGDSITIRDYIEGRLEGADDIDFRQTILASATSTDYVRALISGPNVDNGLAQGATHIRIWRTLEGASDTEVEGLTHRYNADWAIRNETYDSMSLYIDNLSDAAMQGRLDFLQATGYSVPRQTRFIDSDTRVWVGGDPENKGYWFYSELPQNAQFPQKYASWFNTTSAYKTMDPQDNQRDTGTAVLRGDRYFFKERKIFVLFNSDVTLQPQKVSVTIGCAFPETLKRAYIPQFGGECIIFVSEQGPAVLMEGGQVHIAYEYAIKELHRKRGGIIWKADGSPTSWYTRNKVTAVFWNNTWVIAYGDSIDGGSDLQSNMVFGYRFSEDGRSTGAFQYTSEQVGGVNLHEHVLFSKVDNSILYSLSHSLDGIFFTPVYRITRFEDPTKYQDCYIDEADTKFIAVAETPNINVYPPRWSQSAVVGALLIYLKYSDSENVVITATSDDGRLVTTKQVSLTRQSGAANNAAVRDCLYMGVLEGFYGGRFKVKIEKTIPEDGDVEIYSMHIAGNYIDVPFEYQDSMGAFTGNTTFVEDANA